MKLITEVSLPEYPFRIDHRAPLLFMGSCFAENIGALMERSLFPVTINPFGVGRSVRESTGGWRTDYFQLARNIVGWIPKAQYEMLRTSKSGAQVDAGYFIDRETLRTWRRCDGSE